MSLGKHKGRSLSPHLTLPKRISQNSKKVLKKLLTAERERLSLVFRGSKAKAFPPFYTSSFASHIGRYKFMPFGFLLFAKPASVLCVLFQLCFSFCFGYSFFMLTADYMMDHCLSYGFEFRCLSMLELCISSFFSFMRNREPKRAPPHPFSLLFGCFSALGCCIEGAWLLDKVLSRRKKNERKSSLVQLGS